MLVGCHSPLTAPANREDCLMRLRPRGVTLAEVLVVLVILAALAAVLVPVVTNQIRKGDVSRLVGDLTTVRTGVDAFFGDVRRLPGDMEDLSTAVDASDSTIDGNSYPARLRTKWRGPYIDRIVANGGTVITGFEGSLLDNFIAFTAENGITYLTVVVSGIQQSDFYLADEEVDGDTAVAGGVLRFVSPDTVRYLAVPR